MLRTKKTFMLTPIAQAGDRFADFAPYVASVSDAGIVAFQATLPGGATGVFTGNGRDIRIAAESSATGVRRFCSHPDIDERGAICVYAELVAGEQGVVWIDDRSIRAAVDTRGRFAKIGPLGPTMSEGGLAFRADLREGGAGLFALVGETIVDIADTREFVGFQGLPVINGKSEVVFRADLEGGAQAIYVRRGEALDLVVKTGDAFTDLGFFPSMNASGAIVFRGSLPSGVSGIFQAKGGVITPVIDTKSALFESIRGALVNDAGEIFFFATPPGGELGVYAAADPEAPAIVSIGEPFLGSSIAELAQNPVSLNNHGQLAIRLQLKDGRQLIVRADPSG